MEPLKGYPPQEMAVEREVWKKKNKMKICSSKLGILSPSFLSDLGDLVQRTGSSSGCTIRPCRFN